MTSLTSSQKHEYKIKLNINNIRISFLNVTLITSQKSRYNFTFEEFILYVVIIHVMYSDLSFPLEKYLLKIVFQISEQTELPVIHDSISRITRFSGANIKPLYH